MAAVAFATSLGADPQVVKPARKPRMTKAAKAAAEAEAAAAALAAQVQDPAVTAAAALAATHAATEAAVAAHAARVNAAARRIVLDARADAQANVDLHSRDRRHSTVSKLAMMQQQQQQQMRAPVKQQGDATFALKSASARKSSKTAPVSASESETTSERTLTAKPALTFTKIAPHSPSSGPNPDSARGAVLRPLPPPALDPATGEPEFRPASALDRCADGLPPYLIGVHASAAGGPAAAVANAHALRCDVFALDVRNKRRWESPPLAPTDAAAFRATMRRLGYPLHGGSVLPHGSYLCNPASPDPAVVAKTRAALADELRRCARLGVALYNIHPGSAVTVAGREGALARVARGLNEALAATDADTTEACAATAAIERVTEGSSCSARNADSAITVPKKVTIVLENTAGGGETLGRSFEQLADIIALVEDKSRVGVCLDTCHLFAAGYDVATARGFEAVMALFDDVVGARWLRALHVNDSEGACGSRRDRHAQLGAGAIGLECFEYLMNTDRFRGLPLVLETPVTELSGDREQVALLRSLTSKKLPIVGTLDE